MKHAFTALFWLAVVTLLVLSAPDAAAQGVTTAAITGTVSDNAGNALPGANVIALHEPSGTTYGASSRADGRFSIPGMRVGGPYRVTASFVGYENQVRSNIYLTLGVATDLAFTMRDVSVELGEITVTAQRDAIFSSERTGAATSVAREAIEALPTLTRRIDDFARLSPQASGGPFGYVFAGQDNRLNNITVDGSYFNNSFGLAGQPGDRTNVAPISLDAIEQVQINVAPYDVRQGNFVGAGINTVTKSGTNEISGSVYYQYRDEGLVGKKAGELDYNPGTFKFKQLGVRVSGPIIENKLFVFGSFENESLVQPGTTYLANTGGQPVGGNITRVLASDLDNLSSYLKTNFGYETGPYQGYNHETPATRFLLRLDYNLDERNKISLRYTHLDSDTDVLISNSSSLGFGTRRSGTTALNFQNSNYIIMENIRSIVGEWTSRVADNMANDLIIGYTYNDESRDSRGTFFPFVDILDGSGGTSVYTSFGFEPFTPNNELRYSSLQLQNNFTIYGADHQLTFGVSAERYESENVFFPGSQSVYAYVSLADFYTDANDYLANPTRTTSPVSLRRFQLRWSNIPGQTKPVQPLEVFYAGAYAQDEWQVTKDLKLTVGLRLDVPFFGDTGYENTDADARTFRDEGGNAVQYKTKKLPDPNILWSPRVGFNWDVMGDRTTQLRGGTGIFTGRPAYVWISNQIGNTGVLTGFASLDNSATRPFNPNPDHYKPTNVTGAPASSYELALTDPDFRFPQLWRSNIAVDQKLPFDLVATGEFMYNRDLNGVYYINANLPAAQSSFTGVDARPRWTTTTGVANRLTANQTVSNAIVLKNQDVGYSWNIAASLERPFADNWFAKAAYSYGLSKNTVDPGSIAFGSWNSNQHAADPNNPGVAYSSSSPGHRVFFAASYRLEYFDMGATTISFFWEGKRNFIPTFGSNFSHVFSGDLNGDGGTSNDLIYIPRDQSEMNFEAYTVTVSGSPVAFSAQQQADAWEAFIKQDEYLNSNRGKYAERGAATLPMVYRADLSIAQDVFTEIFGKRNALQFRVDLLNVGNLINKKWGVGKRYVFSSNNNVQLLTARPAADPSPVRYRLRNIGASLPTSSFEDNATINDVFRLQFTVRYTFN